MKQKKYRQFAAFLVLALLIILAAVFAPVVSGGVDPLKGNLTDALMPPCKAHIFGTDKMGRDIFAPAASRGQSRFVLSQGFPA